MPIKIINPVCIRESLKMKRGSCYIVNTHMSGALQITQNMLDRLPSDSHEVLADTRNTNQ
jgi:hypothetical protein